MEPCNFVTLLLLRIACFSPLQQRLSYYNVSSMSDKKYETLLFDWDGCIAHSLPAWMKSFQCTFAEYGRSIELPEVLEKKLFINWKPVLEMGVSDLEEFTERMHKYIPLYVPFSELHPTVLDTLKALRLAPRKHAIVTSSRKPQIDAALKFHNLASHFDDMVTFEEVVKPKPDAEPVLKALTKVGGNIETTLIIGDSPADIGAGKAAGITTVLYYPESHEQFYPYEVMKELQPDYFIRHFSELLEIVK